MLSEFEIVPGAGKAAPDERVRFQSKLLNAIGQAVVATEVDGSIAYWNRAAESLFGWRADEVLGLNVLDVVPDFFSRDDAETVFRSLQDGNSWDGEIDLRRKGGRSFTAAVSATPVLSEEGTLCAIIGVASDVSDRKRAQQLRSEMEDQFRLAAETIADILFTLTADGGIDYVNRRYTEVTGKGVESARGLGWLEILHPEDVHGARIIWQAVLETGAPIERKHRIRTSDGTYRWFITRARPIRDDEGRVVRWFGTSTDIDNLVRADQKIKALNASLEARVTERTRQVRALSSALTLAEQRERRRITYLLHDDIQQLLYGLKLKSQLLRQDVGSTDPDVQPAFEDIEAGFDRAIQSIENLTIELSPPVLHGEGLASALEWLAMHTQRQYGLRVDLHIEDDCVVPHEDQRILLFQFIRELLFNVVKHADTQNAEVHVRYSDGNLRVDVHDRGVGFDTGRANDDDEAGNWGLFSIRERLALFGGRLHVESAPGSGTRVTIVAPIQAVA